MALRIPAFTVITVALGLGAHTTAGGGPPTIPPLLLVGVIVALTGRMVAFKEQSLVRLLGSVWGLQAAIHLVLMSRHSGMSSHLTFASLSGHHGHGLTGLPAPVPHVVGSAPMAMETLTPSMLLMHGLAGSAAAFWLRRGEAAVWSAARRILPQLRRVRSLPVRSAALWSVPASWHPDVRPAGVFLLVTDPRRGPPIPRF